MANVSSVQTVGPPTLTNNLVFLSDGFTSNGPYDDLVNTITTMLLKSNPPFSDSRMLFPADGANKIELMRNSVPLDRYLPFWNIYSVFQKSPQPGCSRPAIGVSVSDNLLCYHQPQLERALACNHGLAQSLADVSPAPVRSHPDQVLIVVIVNSSLYGGTGLFQRGVIHIGQFFNGDDKNSMGGGYFEQYASLINHECGHALGGLFDEYDIGSATSSRLGLANCQAPDANSGGPPSPPFWSFWQTVFAPNSATAATYRGKLQTLLPLTKDPVTNVPLDPSIYGVSQVPTQPCGYTNYYKGNLNCMMNHLNDYYMCPVCRENSSVAMLSTGFSFQFPRFPLVDNIMLMSADNATATSMLNLYTGCVLHMPSSLTTDNSFSLLWAENSTGQWLPLPSQASEQLLAECRSCYWLNSTNYLNNAPRDKVLFFSATISDNSIYLSDDTKARFAKVLNQVAYFRLQINSTPILGNFSMYPSVKVISFDFGKAPFIAADQTPVAYMCSQFSNPSNSSGDCELHGTSKSYNAPADIGAALAQYDSYVLYIIGFLVVFFIGLWLYASGRYRRMSGRVVRPIFKTEFSTLVSLIRKVMLLSSVLFMLAALGTIAVSAYYYTKTDVVGKIIVIAGVLVSLGLYVMAFVGFWAVTNRSKKLVIANAAVMFVGLIVLISLTAIIVDFKNKVGQQGSSWTTILQNYWSNLVATNSGGACSLEGILGCSGFFESCAVSSPNINYCPLTCDTYNQNGVACLDRIRKFVGDNYSVATTVLGLCIALMVFAIIFNFVYYFQLRQLKLSIQKRLEDRLASSSAARNVDRSRIDRAKALYVLKSIDDGELQHLVREFSRIDLDKSGSLDKRELGVFFRKALCYPITREEMDVLFETIDVDGDGKISMEEFMSIFKPNFKQHAVTRGGTEMVSLRNMNSGASEEREQIMRRRLMEKYGESGVFDDADQKKSVFEAHGSGAPRTAGSPGPFPPSHLMAQQQTKYHDPML